MSKIGYKTLRFVNYHDPTKLRLWLPDSPSFHLRSSPKAFPMSDSADDKFFGYATVLRLIPFRAYLMSLKDTMDRIFIKSANSSTP